MSAHHDSACKSSLTIKICVCTIVRNYFLKQVKWFSKIKSIIVNILYENEFKIKLKFPKLKWMDIRIKNLKSSLKSWVLKNNKKKPSYK